MSVVTLCTADIHGRAAVGTAPLGVAAGVAACAGMGVVRGAGLMAIAALDAGESMTGRSGSKRESFDGSWLNVAVTAKSPLPVTVQGPVPEQRPLQPSNREPGPGVAA